MRIALLLSAMFCLSTISYGQVGGIQNFIRAGKADASTLTREYFRPLASGLGASVNSGWISKTDSSATFDLRVRLRGGFALIPPEQKSFDLSQLSLNKVRPTNPQQTTAPTLSGSSKNTPEISIIDNGVEVSQVSMPKGSGQGWVPVPQLQFSGHIFPRTQIIGRLVPEIPIGDYGRSSQIGLGVSHQIDQYLTEANIPLNLAVVVGYNYLVGKRNFNLQPQPNALPDPSYLGNYSNQQLRVQFNTILLQIVADKQLNNVRFYGGLGVQSTKMDVKVTGDYPIPVDGVAGTQTQTITDPIGYSQRGDNILSMVGGTAYQWNTVSIFSDFVIAQIPVWNIGFDIQL
jgi:hypothetical protein